jgi:hypothetical protein
MIAWIKSTLERAAWKVVHGIKWAVSIWSEGGPGSSSRVHLAIAFASAVGLTWYAAVTQRDIPANAFALTCTLLGGGTVAYGVNKIAARKDAE